MNEGDREVKKSYQQPELDVILFQAFDLLTNGSNDTYEVETDNYSGGLYGY